MGIIVLDSLLEQTVDNSVPTYIIPKIFAEFQRLAEMEKDGKNTVAEYIKNHHGIKMKGAEKIFKYELTNGDRLLYAHSADLPWLNRLEDSYVLLRFSKHDDQGKAARKFDLKKERGYEYIKDIVDKMSDLEIDAINDSEISIEDYLALAEIINSDCHKAYVIQDDTDYEHLSLDEMDVYLSDEQDKCISDYFIKPCPTLIIGGAGTGKTLIAVHLLINYAKNNSQGQASYFTQSAELRNKVLALFKQYGENVDTNSVEFNDISEFCLKQLGLKHSGLVCTREFLSFVEKTPSILEQCRKAELSPIVVWTEIRGIIKGGMSPEWTRTAPMHQDNFPSSIQSLEKDGYFKRDEGNKKLIWLAKSIPDIEEQIAGDENLSSDEKENLNIAIEYFSGFDPDVRMLTESDYLLVSEERSSVEPEKRSIVWSICKQYDDHLVEKSLYDENDLIRIMYKNGFCAEPKYDLSVIDEVQDYSELQLFFIKELTKGSNIVFAGDEHQNINPASFNESRLHSLFYTKGKSQLKTIRLQKNFRCQQGIIEITNKLADIRRTAIGRGAAEKEEPEEAIRKSDALPTRLAYSEANLASCILELMPYPKAVFLVPDQAAKDRLLGLISQQKDAIISRIGVDRYNARSKSAVFTVAEIKGVEYKYVVCFDLIGTYIKIWQKILSGVHQQTKYRYYFNLLYVAMTRAQEYLCIVDSRLSDALDEKMGIRFIESFDKDKLYISRLSQGETDWFEQARELEQNGDYRNALEHYKAIKAPTDCINRCNYHISIEDKDYDTAVVYGIILNSPEMISDYLDDVKSTDLEQLARAYICLKNDPLNYAFRQINLSKLIESCIPDDLQKEAQYVLLSSLRDAMHEHAVAMLSIKTEHLPSAKESENAPQPKPELAKEPIFQPPAAPKFTAITEEIEKSCDRCKYRVNGTCGQLIDDVCSEYYPIPYVSQEELNRWPKYGTATAIRLGIKLD